MEGLVTIVGIELGVFGVLYLLLWLIVWRPLSNDKKKRRGPFTKGLLNSPGESSLRKVDDLSFEYMSNHSIVMLISGMLIGGLICIFLPADMRNTRSAVMMMGIGVLFILWLVFKIAKDLKERRQYRLGFEGERHTAQAISGLIRDGYGIYHDIPGKKADGSVFNIDHVLVGPAGVVIVETKARSKDAKMKGQNSAKLTYDGQRILFPGGAEIDCLGQAKANAKYLGEELGRRTGVRVRVRAAVCLPGWYLDYEDRFEVHVCNPDMLPYWISKLPPTSLTPVQLNQIRGYLEEGAKVTSE